LTYCNSLFLMPDHVFGDSKKDQKDISFDRTYFLLAIFSRITTSHNTNSNMTRFLSFTLLALASQSTTQASSDTLPLSPLPYDYAALEPHISQRTLEIHHGKHHAKYVNTLNSMIEGDPELEGSSLDEIVKNSYGGSNQDLFNNAAQSWNHDFYWKCMTPNYQTPSKSLVEAIAKDFGSMKRFLKEFSTVGNTAFGSGWAWLVYDSSTQKLVVTKTIGADNPMAMNPDWTPILTMDVWEHAYYLDYQNLRTSYVDTFLKKLVNWKFVEANLDAAVKKQGAEAEL
jgi:Fe-Mn family superoxide dismutase